MMSYVAVAVGVTALGIYGAEQQADAIKQQSEFQANLTELNSRLAEVDSFEARRQGESQKLRVESDLEKALAEQEAFFAGSDVDSTVGAAGDLQIESRLNAGLNILDVENQINNNVAGFRREAAGLRSQANATRVGGQINAQNTRTSGYINAITSGASIGLKGGSGSTSSGGAK